MSRDKQTEIHELAKQMSEAISTEVEQRYIEDEAKLRAVLIENGWRKSTDVAEEIFAEIEKKIDLELSIIRKIIHAKGGRANGKTVLLGKIQMLIDLKNFIAELKKKYESEKENERSKKML